VKARLLERRNKSKSSIAISLAIHVVMFAGLLSITFRYPLGDIFTRREPVEAISVRYIPLKPRAPQAQSGATRAPRARATAPVSVMPSVSSIPVGIPAPAAAVSPSTSAIGAGGEAARSGRDPGLGLGIRPGIPDGRLATSPGAVPRAPETEGQKAERALSAIYQEYVVATRAEMARDSAQRKPGDWSWGGKEGDKWGWDKNGIHVGGITIPNIVLAALPIPVTSNTEPVNMRAREFMRSDIQMHANAMSEDEFRAAVRRIRERVDRERRERMEKSKERPKAPPCC
jgi:hypothetical protein